MQYIELLFTKVLASNVGPEASYPNRALRSTIAEQRWQGYGRKRSYHNARYSSGISLEALGEASSGYQISRTKLEPRDPEQYKRNLKPLECNSRMILVKEKGNGGERHVEAQRSDCMLFLQQLPTFTSWPSISSRVGRTHTPTSKTCRRLHFKEFPTTLKNF